MLVEPLSEPEAVKNLYLHLQAGWVGMLDDVQVETQVNHVDSA
jgi:hypothetical protein